MSSPNLIPRGRDHHSQRSLGSREKFALQGIAGSGGTYTHKTITKLNAEISKLRATTIFTKAEVDEAIVTQREEMIRKLEKEEQKYLKAQIKLGEVRDEIRVKEDYSAHIQKRIEKKDEELKDFEEDRNELEKKLNSMTNKLEESKNEVNMKENQIAILLEKLHSLQMDQEKVVAASLELEKSIREEQNTRMNILHAMLEAELEFKHKSSHLRGIGKSGKRLVDVMISQQEEMRRSINAITKSINDDINNSKGDSSPPRQLLLLN